VSTIQKTLVSPRLYGRNQELEVIQSALKSTVEGNGHCLLIAGDAGIGKSRLITTAIELASHDNIDLLCGICFEQDIALPYGPWIYAIRQYIASINTKQALDLFGHFAPDLAQLLPELQEYIQTERSTRELTPESEKWRLFETLARFITHLASQRPLLIVVEDLHWADATSLELLQFFARRFSHIPILLAATYRLEDHTPQLKRFLTQINRERLADLIQLQPLNRHQVTEMVRAIFEIERPIKPDFLELIEKLTGGNPYFIEEILKSLVETGGIYLSNGEWERRPVIEMQLPGSIRDAVLVRLEKISDEARDLVTLMSAVGKSCTFDLLYATTGHEEDALIQPLKELIEAQLIVEEGPDQFTFRHELTREAVYSGMLKRERRALHRKIAEIIENAFADSLEGFASNLALHYERSEQWEKALQYARQAGNEALALHSPREALEQFNRAIEAASQLSMPADIQLLGQRASALSLLGQFNQAYTDLEMCLNIARTSEDQRAEWQALLNLALLTEGRDYVKSGEFTRQALALARQLVDPYLTAHSLIRLTIWYANMNRGSEGAACVREALSIFEELQDKQGMALALSSEGNIHVNAGDFRQGSNCYSKAIPLFKEANDLQGQFDCLINLSLCSAIDLYYTQPPMMSISRARRYAEAALDLARQINSKTDETIAMIRLGMLLRTQGRYAQALELTQQAIDLAEGLDHAEWISFGWMGLGEIQRDLLNLDQARTCYERSLQEVNRSGNVEIKIMVAADLARVCMDQGKLDEAEKLLSEIWAEANVHSMAFRLVEYGFARLALERNEPDRSAHIVNELQTLDQAYTGNNDLHSPFLSYMRGDALAATGEFEDARLHLMAARDAANQMGALPLLWRIHLSLARLEDKFDHERARQHLGHSREIVTHLADALPDPDLREHFIQAAVQYFDKCCHNGSKAAAGPLTAREWEVVALIQSGISNQEIADQLVLSKRTVEKHISNILSKLMLSTRAQIIVWGLEHPSPF
jgi:predicted ATPase/DNA-binding CsgD family transcriptional regulator